MPCIKTAVIINCDSMGIIQTKDLTKKYRDFIAVNNVNLEISENECYGLLGPNGAGKTTLIRMITGATPITSGKVEVMGKDITANAREIKAKIGVVPQSENLDEDLPVLQNLLTFARYFGIPSAEARQQSNSLLDLVHLTDKRNSKIKELSGGMRRRLLIARGLINQPKIVFLDEPTVGLDPQARHQIWQKLQELKDNGITELLCTHSMDEAYRLCTRVGIMNEGKIVAEGEPDRLISEFVGKEVLEIKTISGKNGELSSRLSELKTEYVDMGDRIRIFRSDADTIMPLLTKYETNLKRETATLEDVFFRLTGKELT